MKRKALSPVFEGLTHDQREATNAFKAWLEKGYEGIPFVLTGYAGSGKTFLSIKLLRLVEELGLCWTVVAPTHKAVGVLREALNREGISPTWHPSTIHRLLRLKLKRKGDLEVCEQTEQTEKSLEQLGLVLVDEASMIDSNLLQISLKCAHLFNTRLVFVGDSAQLPPIGEPQSPVFSMERCFESKLSEVVRHQGPVLKLANCLRDGSIPCLPPPCLPSFETSNGTVGCLNELDWLDRAKESLREASNNDDPDAARILCFTNRVLERLVPHARRAIHGEMADQLPVLPGEVLISRKAVMAPASLDGVSLGEEEPDMVLGSNRELLVRDVIPEKCDLREFGLENKDIPKTSFIDTLIVKVQGGETEFSLRLLPSMGTKARETFDETLKFLSSQAKDVGKKEGRVYWRRFFLIRDAFASLGPAAVLTVHRSQGSSFGKVFVAPDVFWPKEIGFRRQLVYVAVSRAKQEVCFVGGKGRTSLESNWLENLC